MRHSFSLDIRLDPHPMSKTPPLTHLTRLQDYFLAFGSIGHYLKRAAEFHESRKTPEPLPTRWLHLAERSLVRADYPKYLDFIASSSSPANVDLEKEKNRLAELDLIVERIHSLLLQPDVLASFRQNDSP